jgi:hypothetical protein
MLLRPTGFHVDMSASIANCHSHVTPCTKYLTAAETGILDGHFLEDYRNKVTVKKTVDHIRCNGCNGFFPKTSSLGLHLPRSVIICDNSV